EGTAEWVEADPGGLTAAFGTIGSRWCFAGVAGISSEQLAQLLIKASRCGRARPSVDCLSRPFRTGGIRRPEDRCFFRGGEARRTAAAEDRYHDRATLLVELCSDLRVGGFRHFQLPLSPERARDYHKPALRRGDRGLRRLRFPSRKQARGRASCCAL